MINVGVIGLGALWESRYRTALAMLSERIRVRAVYDPVAERAIQVAAELGAVPVHGILALLNLAEVRGILFLDADWHAAESLELLCRGGKPAFVAGSLGSELQRIARLRDLSNAAGITVMPEFSRRYTPATSRLHELMATRLGKPGRVLVEAVAPDSDAADTLAGQGTMTDFLLGLFDWCCYVIRTSPASLTASLLQPNSSSGPPGQRILVQFSQRRSGGEAPEAEILIHARPTDAPAKSLNLSGDLRFTIACEFGQATIEDVATIEWRNESAAERESLTADRTETEVMLDHFCRRVAGGLIPVADIADVHRSFQMAQAVDEGLITGQPVSLSSL